MLAALIEKTVIKKFVKFGLYTSMFLFTFLLVMRQETTAVRASTEMLSEDCLNSNLYYLVGSTLLTIPSNPAIVVTTVSKSTSNSIFGIKAFCQHNTRKETPLPVKNFSIGFMFIDRGLKEQSAEFSHWACKNGNGDDLGLLCKAASFKPAAYRRLFVISIFKQGIEVQKTDTPAPRYENFYSEWDAAIKAGKPLQATRTPKGSFDQFPNGYFIARNNSVPGIGNDPATFYCRNAEQTGWISCTTIRDLDGGLLGLVGFYTPSVEFEQTALGADQALSNFFAFASADNR